MKGMHPHIINFLHTVYSFYQIGLRYFREASLFIGWGAGINRGANKIGRREKGGDKFWTTPGGGEKILDFPRRGGENF